MPDEHGLVVFSHLRWDFVYQRPQHVLSRLASWRRVLFIEEPCYQADCAPHWERSTPAPNVTVCRLRTPDPAPGFDDAHVPTMLPLLHALLAAEGMTEVVAWLYTPLALPLAQSLPVNVLVYDCMDELSAFKFAPPQLLQREAELLAAADLVFTGGPSLYRAKRDRHPHVLCLPSSVDAAHFGAANTGIEEPPDQASLPHPRLGFYGVIDERMDLVLLGALAEAHPEWQIVLVGPVVKCDPAHLPRQPNILYTGQRSYDNLPAYLAGWDVCLLPFARNESTQFISPTKTLEYMAAERMIVSTPITDVADTYGEIVFLGDTHAAFIAACARALHISAAERAQRIALMRAVLAQTSWDATAAAMRAAIDAVLEQQRTSAAV